MSHIVVSALGGKKLLLVLSIVALLAAGCSSSQQVNVVPTPTPPADETPSERIYTNSKYGFQITIPNTWTEQAGSNSDYVSFTMPGLPTPPTGGAGETGGKNFILIANLENKEIPRGTSKGKKVISGVEWSIYLYSTIEGDVYNYFTPIKNTNYEFTVHDEDKSLLEQVLNSFKLTTTSQTSDWKTYTNSEYGFEFKYPGDMNLKENKLNNTSQYATQVAISKNPINFNSFDQNKNPISFLIATPGSISNYKNPCANTEGECMGEEIRPLECENYLSQPVGSHTGTADGFGNFNYSILNIDGVKGCSQYNWKFFGESSSAKKFIFNLPKNYRFEASVFIGYGLGSTRVFNLTDMGLAVWEKEKPADPKLDSTPIPGSSENVELLNQIVSSLKFTK